MHIRYILRLHHMHVNTFEQHFEHLSHVQLETTPNKICLACLIVHQVQFNIYVEGQLCAVTRRVYSILV